MSEWTKQRLDEMIADCVEESFSLDYKRADSLAKSDGKKREVTKDVASFANSAGGILIYGIAEYEDEPRKHRPERIDAIVRDDISKEWLDQVIQTIQPRIDGVIIHPVTISESNNTVCYVVEVPQSHTAHMARDHRYHKRLNFTTAEMEDYEVRDVMARRSRPKVRASLFINKRADRFKPEGLILVKVENYGSILVRDFMIELEIPYDVGGLIHVEHPMTCGQDKDGDFYRVRMTPEYPAPPLFPMSNKTLLRKIYTDVQIHTLDNHPIKARPYLGVGVFADEMPPIRAKLALAAVLAGWTDVQRP